MTGDAAILNRQQKADVVRSYAGAYEVFVETGLHNGGGMVDSVPDLFRRRYAIDVRVANVLGVQFRDVRALLGDSARVLPELLALLDQPALFWLDAHTNELDGSDQPPGAICVPTVEELAAIAAWPYGADSTVLVDDVRLFHDRRPWSFWPRFDEIRSLVAHHWDVVVSGDILRCTPR